MAISIIRRVGRWTIRQTVRANTADGSFRPLIIITAYIQTVEVITQLHTVVVHREGKKEEMVVACWLASCTYRGEAARGTEIDLTACAHTAFHRHPSCYPVILRNPKKDYHEGFADNFHRNSLLWQCTLSQPSTVYAAFEFASAYRRT